MVPPLVERLVGRPISDDNPSAQYAKLSIPFVVATALIRNNVFISDFWVSALSDPLIHSMARRISVVRDPQILDENAMMPIRLRITLKTGAVHELRLEQMMGHPDKALTRDQHLNKFQACWDAGADHLPSDNRERLVEMIDRLDELESVEEIIRLLTPRTELIR